MWVFWKKTTSPGGLYALICVGKGKDTAVGDAKHSLGIQWKSMANCPIPERAYTVRGLDSLDKVFKSHASLSDLCSLVTHATTEDQEHPESLVVMPLVDRSKERSLFLSYLMSTFVGGHG